MSNLYLTEANRVDHASRFKMHLRSKYTASQHLQDALPDLPPSKTVVDVLSDFLSYLYKCTASYIADTHPNGAELWDSFASATHAPPDSSNASNDGIRFVISHPNGWEGKEQAQMRKAVVNAKLVPDTPEGHRRMTFVTEGEASLHFAVENGLLAHAVNGDGIVVVDAGGGTIDISTYKKNSKDHNKIFEEISVPKCHFLGSIFVTLTAKEFLKGELSITDLN